MGARALAVQPTLREINIKTEVCTEGKVSYLGLQAELQ